MLTPTPNTIHFADASARTFRVAFPVLWLELPAPATAPSQPGGEGREPWYDPAAVYEEPERWDGMA